MRKTHLFSLVAMLLVLCLALSACAGSSDSGSSSSAEPAQPNPNLESYPSSDIAGFKHEVGSCVFYTEHDLEDWIEGGVFDFYGMVSFFGLTEYDETLANMGGYSAQSAPEKTHLWTVMKDDGDAWEFHTFVCEFAGGDMFAVSYNNGNRHDHKAVLMTNQVDVPYELLEVFLFTLETYDAGNEDVISDVKALGLPDYFSFVTN